VIDFIFLRLFPLGLMLGGLGLGVVEVRHYLQERPHVQRGRFLRRATGAVLLLVLGVLVMLGRIPDQLTMPPDQVWTLFRHWLWVMAIALVLTLLALWDALEGVRHLRGFFEDVEKEEIKKIQQHLAGTRKER
jgi:hypothetical protein